MIVDGILDFEGLQSACLYPKAYSLHYGSIAVPSLCPDFLFSYRSPREGGDLLAAP